MRIRRYLKRVTAFLTQLAAALLKVVLTTLMLGFVVVAIMHYMGVPVPSGDDLWRGVSRLAHAVS